MSFLEKGIGEEKRWFYPFSAFFVAVCLAMPMLWSMLFPQVQLRFGLDSIASIVLAATFQGLGSMIIGPPITGFIFDKKGPKLPILIAGVIKLLGMLVLARMLTLDSWNVAMPLWYLGSFLVGIGWGMWNGTYTTVVARWFPDKVGTAMGLAVAGGSAGAVVLAPIVGRMIVSIGFSSSIFIIFGVFAVIVLYAVAFVFWKVPSPDWTPAGWQPAQSVSGLAKVEKHFTFPEAIRDARFWILYGGFLTSACAFLLFAQNSSFILMEGLSKGGVEMETILNSILPKYVSITALAGLLGTFGWGWVMDKIGGPFKTLPIVYFVSGVLIWVFYMGYTSVSFLLISAFLLYFFFGGEPTVHYAAVPNVFGRKHIGKIMTTLNAFSVGIGISVGPFIGGYIADKTGGFYWALVLAIALRMIATAFSLTGMMYTKKIEGKEAKKAVA